LARLTPEENHGWEQLFSIAVLEGMSDAKADRKPGTGVPRLGEYDGCLL
jgi:hypothetical protein